MCRGAHAPLEPRLPSDVSAKHRQELRPPVPRKGATKTPCYRSMFVPTRGVDGGLQREPRLRRITVPATDFLDSRTLQFQSSGSCSPVWVYCGGPRVTTLSRSRDGCWSELFPPDAPAGSSALPESRAGGRGHCGRSRRSGKTARLRSERYRLRRCRRCRRRDRRR